MLKTFSNTCVRSKGKSERTHRAFFSRLNFPHVRSGTRAFGNAFLAQNSQQKSVPDLNVLTVAFLALKKYGFSKKKQFSKKKKSFYLFSMQLFSADAMVFSKKLKKNF